MFVTVLTGYEQYKGNESQAQQQVPRKDRLDTASVTTASGVFDATTRGLCPEQTNDRPQQNGVRF